MTTKQLNTITRKAEAVAAKHTAEAKANEATPATRYPFAAFVILETKADRAAKVAEAIIAAVELLTPTARRVYDCFASGKGRNETARTLNKGLATITEHKANITRKIAAAVMEAAPDIDPDIIAAADLSALLKLAK